MVPNLGPAVVPRLQELVQLGDEVHREKPKPGSPARAGHVRTSARMGTRAGGVLFGPVSRGVTLE